MRIIFHKSFEKDFKKLATSQKEKTKKRLALFLKNPFSQELNNHSLRGKYNDYRSINIAGDLRAIFKLLNENETIFVALSAHSDLYS